MALTRNGDGALLVIDDDGTISWWTRDGETREITVTLAQEGFDGSEIARGRSGRTRSTMVMQPGYRWVVAVAADGAVLVRLLVDRTRATRITEPLEGECQPHPTLNRMM